MLSDGQKGMIKKTLRILLSVVPHRQNLNLLALKHGTDKRSHDYIRHYQQHFGPRRKKQLTLLEIGVGGYGDPQAGGASHRMWQEYFPNSMIYGIDIEDKSTHEEKRIKILQGSQNDPTFLQSVAAQIGQIDIIIDDGSHVCEHIITSFRTLFPCLADGGIYVIEDLHTSYWPQYGGDWQNLKAPGTSMSLLKDLVDGLNHECIPNRQPGSFDQSIVSVHFHPSIAFIVKGGNRHVLSQHTRKAMEKARGIPSASG